MTRIELHENDAYPRKIRISTENLTYVNHTISFTATRKKKQFMEAIRAQKNVSVTTGQAQFIIQFQYQFFQFRTNFRLAIFIFMFNLNANKFLLNKKQSQLSYYCYKKCNNPSGNCFTGKFSWAKAFSIVCMPISRVNSILPGPLEELSI